MALRAEGADLGVKVSVVCPEGVESALVANAPVVNLSRGMVDVIAESFGMMPVERAARLIVRGVARNRTVIVFPASARWLWRLCRISPPFWIWLGTRILRRFRGRAAALRPDG
jgi:short-subunit dehydrogenase